MGNGGLSPKQANQRSDPGGEAMMDRRGNPCGEGLGISAVLFFRLRKSRDVLLGLFFLFRDLCLVFVFFLFWVIFAEL